MATTLTLYNATITVAFYAADDDEAVKVERKLTEGLVGIQMGDLINLSHGQDTMITVAESQTEVVDSYLSKDGLIRNDDGTWQQ